MPNPNGGYMALNFSGVESGATVPGLFTQLASNRKAVIVESLTIEGTTYNAQPGYMELSGADYKITIPAGTITVTNGDVVTFAATVAE